MKIRHINYYNDNTPEVLEEFNKEEIIGYIERLRFSLDTTVDSAKTYKIFVKNMKYIEKSLPEYMIWDDILKDNIFFQTN